MPRQVGRATPTESRAQSTPAVDLDIDEFDLRSNNSLNFWYDEVDNADGSCYDESTWLRVGRRNAAAENVPIGFWTCAACRSTGFFDSLQPLQSIRQNKELVSLCQRVVEEPAVLHPLRCLNHAIAIDAEVDKDLLRLTQMMLEMTTARVQNLRYERRTQLSM